MQTGRPQVTYEAPEVPCYYDDPRYKRFAIQVAGLLKRAGSKGVTMGEVLRTLGYEHQAWLADALAQIGTIETGIAPTRYVYAPIVPVGVYPKSNISLFPKSIRPTD